MEKHGVWYVDTTIAVDQENTVRVYCAYIGAYTAECRVRVRGALRVEALRHTKRMSSSTCGVTSHSRRVYKPREGKTAHYLFTDKGYHSHVK